MKQIALGGKKKLMKTKLKIKGYFICSPKGFKNPKTKRWEYEKPPCGYKIPIYDLDKARNKPFPICKCGCRTALYDIEMNKNINKLMFGTIK